MKVLQVNCVYNIGSTGKIVHDIHLGLVKNGIESVVCYGRGEKISERNVYKTCGEIYSKINNLCSRITGIMYGGCFFSTRKLFKIIKKEHPDIVHLHCLNGHFVNIYKLIDWLKKNNYKTVITLHAEFMHTANCAHALDCEKWKTGCGQCPRLKKETKSWFIDATHKSWIKMKNAFEGFNDATIVSVSPWLMDRAKQSPIFFDKKHLVILNGIDTDIFKLHYANELKTLHGLSTEKIVFHATAGFSNNPDHLKGGYFVLKLAELMKNDGVKFIVAGEHDKDISVPENLIMLGQVKDQKLLAQYYSMADVTLLTSKKETFSMISAESLSCGTPVVGFKAGAPEQISIPEFSEFVEYGNINLLLNSLKKFLELKVDKELISSSALKKYSKGIMVDKYLEVYRSMINH